MIDGPQHRPSSYCLDATAIHPHGRQNSSASFHCGNGSCSWFCTMAALVGLQSRCQIDTRCEHRVWAQAGSLRTGSQPLIGRRERLAKGYTLGRHPTGRRIRPLTRVSPQAGLAEAWNEELRAARNESVRTGGGTRRKPTTDHRRGGPHRPQGTHTGHQHCVSEMSVKESRVARWPVGAPAREPGGAVQARMPLSPSRPVAPATAAPLSRQSRGAAYRMSAAACPERPGRRSRSRYHNEGEPAGLAEAWNEELRAARNESVRTGGGTRRKPTTGGEGPTGDPHRTHTDISWWHPASKIF